MADLTNEVDPLELPWLRRRNAPYRESIAHAEHGGPKYYGERPNWGYGSSYKSPLREKEPWLGAFLGDNKVLMDDALGRFQLSGKALLDAKWLKIDRNVPHNGKTISVLDWTQKARDRGIGSIQDFLKYYEGQEDAFDDVSAKNEQYAANKKLNSNIGLTFQGRLGPISITRLGLNAALHRGGIGDAEDFFRDLKERDFDTRGRPVRGSTPREQRCGR